MKNQYWKDSMLKMNRLIFYIDDAKQIVDYQEKKKMQENT